MLPPEINGPVVDYFSVMPLHINRGLCLQFLNILEDHAVALDLSIRDANGLTSEGVLELYLKQKEICLSITESEEEALKKKDSVEVLQMHIKGIQDDYPESSTKVNGKYVNNDSQSEATRKKAIDLAKDVKSAQASEKELTNVID